MNNQVVRQRYYTSDAMEHPAKAHIPMMIWVLKKFVNDGDVVLDPLAGIGTTMVEGMRLFPNSLFIGIELEEKFTKWAQASIKKVEEMAKRDWFMKIGKAICVQGDAKELEKVLKEKVDKIITSPPYSGVMDSKRHTDSGICGRDPKMTKMRYVDKIVSSPPYAGAKFDCKHGLKKLSPNLKGRKAWEEKVDNNPKSKDNIANLDYGKVDKIISSPPYSDIIKEVKAGHQDLESQHEAVKARARAIAREAEKAHPGTNYHTPGRLRAIEAMISGYSINPENIGNTKGKTYLEAMLLVYYQCYKVLKPEGLMVLITKDFIRDFKRVHLGEDTIKLCQMAGFKHIATYHRKIRHPSFWRIHYYQKHPEVERIECEDIFCFRKGK